MSTKAYKENLQAITTEQVQFHQPLQWNLHTWTLQLSHAHLAVPARASFKESSSGSISA